MLPSSCAALVSVSLSVSAGFATSPENEPPVGVGRVVSVLLDLAGRIEDICPLVLSIAPFKRSSMSQPLTPGFLDSRWRASSTESVPFEDYRWTLVSSSIPALQKSLYIPGCYLPCWWIRPSRGFGRSVRTFNGGLVSNKDLRRRACCSSASRGTLLTFRGASATFRGSATNVSTEKLPSGVPMRPER